MKKIRIYNGASKNAPIFDVYLCALRGKNALKFTVAGERSHIDGKIQHACDNAIKAVFEYESNAPESAFIAAYQVDTTPPVSTQYGAPIGRANDNLDLDQHFAYWKATKVKLDSGGYDKGGAYWGLRSFPNSLYAVQDGAGNIAYVDAKNAKAAINYFTIQ